VRKINEKTESNTTYVLDFTFHQSIDSCLSPFQQTRGTSDNKDTKANQSWGLIRDMSDGRHHQTRARGQFSYSFDSKSFHIIELI
jgi:hypothetical protein